MLSAGTSICGRGLGSWQSEGMAESTVEVKELSALLRTRGVGSYRSASRLAASYDAFADALMIQGAGLGDVKTLVEALTPNVDFGGNAAPTREIVDLATGILRNHQPTLAKKD